VEGIKVVQTKEISLLHGEIIVKEEKYTEIFKKIFSRASGPNSIKRNTNYPWMKGIQVCPNKGPGPHQRGDNHKKSKIGVGSFQNLILKNYEARKS
jgi:hypothetical protein